MDEFIESFATWLEEQQRLYAEEVGKSSFWEDWRSTLYSGGAVAMSLAKNYLTQEWEKYKNQKDTES